MIEFEGDVIQKDSIHQLKKFRMQLELKDSEITRLNDVIFEKDITIQKLNEKVTELNGSNKWLKDRLSTANQKIRGFKDDAGN